jgi:hypothetical protein
MNVIFEFKSYYLWTTNPTQVYWNTVSMTLVDMDTYSSCRSLYDIYEYNYS